MIQECLLFPKFDIVLRILILQYICEKFSIDVYLKNEM